MQPLGGAACHPEQAGDRIFGDVDQAGSGPHSASFTQMINDRCRLFLSDLGIEQRGAASLRELLAAGATAQEPDLVLAIDFAHGEIGLARETKSWALGIHTR
jgi:hypothetical protein